MDEHVNDEMDGVGTYTKTGLFISTSLIKQQQFEMWAILYNNMT